MKQLNFSHYSDEFKEYWRESGRKVHGGAHAKGKRKTARPFSAKKPIHVVMRSSLAKGSLSFLNPKHRASVNSLVYEHADKSLVIVDKYSNNGNHIHLLVRAKRREYLQKFLRSISGMIARQITGAKKGNPQGKFWDALVFTRIAEWGKAYQNLKNYVIQNILEAAGAIAYQPRQQITLRSG